jgi:phospholipase A1
MTCIPILFSTTAVMLRPLQTLLLCSLLLASAANATLYEECLLEKMESMGGSTTLSEVKALCIDRIDHNNAASPADIEQDESSAITQREEITEDTMEKPFAITAHQPNYFLYTYNFDPNVEPFELGSTDLNEGSLDNEEIKFQVSIKAPLWVNMFGSNANLWLAYTNTSWWQAFNSNSAPFRETNHEPELFVDWETDLKFAGFDWRLFRIGFTHESNGRGGSLSRSWNRIIGQVVAERGNFYASTRLWWRLPEDEKDATADDNPDIEDYLGYGEFTGLYKFGKQNLGFMLRNNLRRDNNGAIQVDYTFPLTRRLRGQVQYFSGYGESLIDYNAYTNRIGIGIMLNDWL